MTVAALDAMPTGEATVALRECCGAPRWIAEMIARRPFASLSAVRSTCDEIWRSLTESDLRSAFAHHPRIGERTSARPQGERSRNWSSSEQSGIETAPDALRDSIAEVNRAYEERFGYIYIVFAEGRSAEELLRSAEARLANEPEQELRVASEELRRITQLRLTKLLTLDEGVTV